jgi:hypothetical protein
MKLLAPLLLIAAMALLPRTAAALAKQADYAPPAKATPSLEEQAKQRNRQQLELQMVIESFLGRTGNLNEIVPATYNDLHSQKDRLELQLAGEKVKEEAIQQKIDALTKQASEQIDKDPIMSSLQKIADQKQKDVARLHELVRTGLAPAGDDDRAISDAAEALVHVQERREAITAAVGGGIMPSLTKELISVSLDIAEQEATLKALGDRLERAEKARDCYQEWLRLGNEPLPSPTQPTGR